MNTHVNDIAFTPAVKAEQAARGSREFYEKHDWRDSITPDIAEFIAERDSFYLATASAEGQPYIQHRGGPRGFLRVIDEKTLAFADYTGNKQYITTGNLAENDRAYIFLMDYETRSRVKIWGRAHVTDDKATIAMLMPEGYRAKPQQAIVFDVAALDTNCSQHIPMKLDVAEVAGAFEHLKARIAELEAKLAVYESQTPDALER
ncbi:MAG: pyridoxamine 5'-phosphate oxidase family protein [Parvibaculum sp.]|uniref:pyridoxamine 5'-phosphate oxidase family protein n=1 Tax=Parvibaculum sp. TaxID=2024848 RepID=UPI0025F6178E|nr:pyridoxamine 5'-phosphate oxidase family protein [Parvibaculum sp.]MCE9648333.1 pyridoxamine 5'-phosphate oxidase family protein [Parvibaculum sp.]